MPHCCPWLTPALMALLSTACAAGDDESGGGGSGAANTGPGLVAADGVAIRAIDLYQAIRVPLMDVANPVSVAPPIVAGRDALMRIYYEQRADYGGGPLRARLTIGEAEPIEIDANISGISTVENLGSTLNLTIPGELVGAGGYRVELLQPNTQSSGSNAEAHYPAEGQAVIAAHAVGASVRIVLVPFSYAADGSGRLPDTSEEQAALYRDNLLRMYPTPAIDIVVLDAVNWNWSVLADGTGWSELLDRLIGLRQQYGAAPDEYYYGVFAPAAGFNSYCQSSCITGLSMLAGPTDPWARAGIGLGFSGQDSVDTMAHEIGHSHGLGHTKCSTFNGVDLAYTPDDGSIGVWGYDAIGGQLIDPAFADLMGYCDPFWIGDYHWNALFERIKLVNGASMHNVTDGATYERILVAADGSARWSEPLDLSWPPSGETTVVSLNTSAGTLTEEGHFYPYSHLGGGMLLVPANPDAVSASAQWPD